MHGLGKQGPPKKSPPASSQAASVRIVQLVPMQQAPVWAIAPGADHQTATMSSAMMVQHRPRTVDVLTMGLLCD
jgi:hypothetical protein